MYIKYTQSEYKRPFNIPFIAFTIIPNFPPQDQDHSMRRISFTEVSRDLGRIGNRNTDHPLGLSNFAKVVKDCLWTDIVCDLQQTLFLEVSAELFEPFVPVFAILAQNHHLPQQQPAAQYRLLGLG